MRVALEKLEGEHRAMVAALHANGNMTQEGFEKALGQLHETYKGAVDFVLGVDPYENDPQETVDEFVSHQWWTKPVTDEEVDEDEVEIDPGSVLA